MNRDMMSTLIMMAFVFVFFYGFILLPQKKKEKHVQQMHDSLKVGDEIATVGGILGKIINISNDVITIEASAEKTKINIKKRAIAEVIDNSKSN